MALVYERLAEPLRESALRTLRPRLLGDLILPGDEHYDSARQVQVAQVDRSPAAIVRAADAADVLRGVAFAREHDLPLAVRSGGHSLAGYGTADGAVVLDLSHMKGLSVDPARQTVWAQPGVNSGDLAPRAHAHGLALSTGDTASVGLGGLTLGGGIGWMVRKYGLTIDSLLSAEMVTPDGRLITASADEHPDLFWALRGGGGNFGVVTGMEFRLSPAASVFGGALILPATREVLRGYVEYTPDAPEGLTTIANLMHLPPLPFVPADQHGALAFVVLVCYVGDPDTGQRAVDPLRALATPIGEALMPLPYPAMFDFTREATQRVSGSIRSAFLDDLPDDAVDAILDAARRPTSPQSMVQIRGLGGAMARVPADATAFAHRDSRLFLAIMNFWADPIEAPVHQAWTQGLWQAVRPHVLGVYVNFLEDEGEARVREAYPSATYARLAEVKHRYDPTNLFRLNQNVVPASR